ncbi:DnaA ATPase domain-containing protein [Butyrivibrio sp. XBB1001]|uniref:DnaA ATPase domain-containing protein n=1 Tax=Butyrivibrio sp. XBB1001 TaxID=1280682 RepID=UPI00041B8821|nr:DnaA/Hda family protein [Butyrivibrio sp. XBB1001]
MYARNRVYTFENFDVDRRNKFAFEAAKEVTNEPGGRFNPLYLYGKRYDGKTHLLKAMERDLREKKPLLDVLYVRGEDFDNDLLSAISSNQYGLGIKLFREKYRNVDVLLVDDIDYFMERRVVLNELINTFDSLYLQGKQIVFSADRRPTDLGEMDNLFRGKLEMGLVIGIRN